MGDDAEQLIDAIKALRTDIRDLTTAIRAELHATSNTNRQILVALRDLVAELEHIRTAPARRENFAAMERAIDGRGEGG